MVFFVCYGVFDLMKVLIVCDNIDVFVFGFQDWVLFDMQFEYCMYFVCVDFFVVDLIDMGQFVVKMFFFGINFVIGLILSVVVCKYIGC